MMRIVSLWRSLEKLSRVDSPHDTESIDGDISRSSTKNRCEGCNDE